MNPKTVANLIINYIAPSSRRLGIKPEEFMGSKVIASWALLLGENYVSMSQFKEIIKAKEESWKTKLNLQN